jgi:phage shock protein A
MSWERNAAVAGSAAEIAQLRAENERLKRQLGEIKSEAAELATGLRRALVDAATFQARSERLGAALKGIAEYCSADGSTLGAIERLIAIRNTAERALRAVEQERQSKTLLDRVEEAARKPVPDQPI